MRASAQPGTLEQALRGQVPEAPGAEADTRPYGLTIEAQVRLRQILAYARTNPAGAMRLALQHFGRDPGTARSAIELLTVEMTR
jgi:hypothetical protein